MLSPDIGVSEMLVVAIVALIVVGPKDLPLLLRRLGQFLAKLRGMASEFRASFEDMARQSELDELRKEVEAMRSGQFTSPVGEAMDSIRDPSVDQVFADIESGLKSGEVNFAPPMAYGSPEETAALEAPAKAARKPRAKAAKVAETPPAPPARKPRAKTATKLVEAPPAATGRKPRAKPAVAPAPKPRRAKAGTVT